MLLGNGDGSFQPQVTDAVGTYSTSIAMVAGDFNGDGRTDLAATSYYGTYANFTGAVSVLLSNGDGTFQPQMTYAVGSQPRAIVSGDFNGDGRTDLAVAGDYGVDLLLGNGDGTFQRPSRVSMGGTMLATGVRTLAILPGEARVARIATRARRYLVSAVECGRPGAERFVEIFRRRGHDPALVLAELCQRQLRRVERMPEGLGRPRTAKPPVPKSHWPVLRSGDLPPRLEGPALRFAYAMRDELIVADARILQAQCDELKNAPPETEDALRRHILRIGKPYCPEPDAFSRRYDRPDTPPPPRLPERPLRQWATTIGRVFRAETEFDVFKPIPKPSRRSGVYQADSEFDVFGPNDPTGGIVAEHDFNLFGPAPPPGPLQALTEWDVFKPIPGRRATAASTRPSPTSTPTTRYPGSRPPPAPRAAATRCGPEGRRHHPVPPNSLLFFFRHPATRSRGPRRRAGREDPES